MSNNRRLGISSADSTRRYTGVGVLILTNYCNRPHLVVGREAFKSIKVDDEYCVSVYEEFGGGIQKPSLGLEANACFELKEETCNLFNIDDPEILKKGINKYYDIPFKEDRLYRIYVIYIEDIVELLPHFQKNRDVLLSQANNYYKYRHFLEMDAIGLIALDDIKNAIGHKQNYICIYPEDNAYNDKVTSKFVGMLRVSGGNFLSKRLAQFLNRDYGTVGSKIHLHPNSTPIDSLSHPEGVYDKSSLCGTGFTGLDACYEIFREGFINCKFYPEQVKKEKLMQIMGYYQHPTGSNKLKFLDLTTSILIV